MIKLVCFIHRHPDLDRDAFRKHWRQQHGPLIASLPELARHVARYEQNTRLDADYARDARDADSARDGPQDDARGHANADRVRRASEFDGATIMWFESMDAYQAFARSPLYAEHVAPDEARFMDRTRTLYFFTDEAETKIGGAAEQATATVKLMALLRRKNGLSAEDFHAYWSGPHADLFTSTPALRDHILAYQQNHRCAADYARDPETHWDGMAEQWYTSLEQFAIGAGGAPFEEIVVPDEERFIDREATRFILCSTPHVVLPAG